MHLYFEQSYVPEGIISTSSRLSRTLLLLVLSLRELEEFVELLLDTSVSCSFDFGVMKLLSSSSQAESANRDVTEKAKSFACKLKITIVLLSSKYK